MGKVSKCFYCLGVCCIGMVALIIQVWSQVDELTMLSISLYGEYGLSQVDELTMLDITFYVCLVTSGILIGTLCFDIARLHPADSHTFFSLIMQYYIFHLQKYLAIPRYRSFVKQTKCVKETQEKILTGILDKNCFTAYGQDYNFSWIKCREDFVKMHPITNHHHYEHYIDRICEGEIEVITKDPVLCFALSSGTTGKSKKIPFTRQATNFFKMYSKLLSDVMPDLKRIGVIRVKPKSRTTCKKCGIPEDSMVHFIGSNIPYNIIPRAATEIADEKVALYLGALFCLKEHELSVLEPLLSTMAYAFFKTIEGHVEVLCNDIELGTISDHIDLDARLRRTLQAYLKPDPARASEVRAELSAGIVGLAKRLWPHLSLVNMVTSGGFTPQFRYLKKTFLQGVFCKGFCCGGTEGVYGMDFERHEATLHRMTQYTLMVDLNFFEFIAEEDTEKASPATYFADQVEPGKSYELVITTAFGLYRYRTGDVIKVVDFFNLCPVFEFQYRVGQLLNLVFEKTPESVLYREISMAEEEWTGASVHDYTATESVCLEGEHGCGIGLMEKCYVLFLEVTKSGIHYLLNEEQKEKIDKHLCDIFTNYNSLRAKGSIGPIKVIQVKQGTFGKVRQMLNKERQNQQYKTPRAMRKPEVLKLLAQNNVTLFKSLLT